MSKSEYDRQAAMSTAVYLLTKTKQYDDAYKLALEQVKKAPAPYYFMNYLARIDNKRGDKDKALTWAKNLGRPRRVLQRNSNGRELS